MKFRRGPKRPKNWEMIRVFDEIAEYTWTASLPLEVISGRLPLGCRYTQELATAKYIGMAIWGFGVLSVAYLLIFFIGTANGSLMPLVWHLVLSGLASPIGILFGYLKGYKFFVQSPVWQVRRLYVRKSQEGEVFDYRDLEIDYESLPIIVPILHTKLTGLPMAQASRNRIESATESAMAFKSQGSNGSVATLTKVDKANLAAAYSPRSFRASSLYEILQARAVRELMRRKGGDNNRLQKIAMVGMAFGSFGILIVVMLLFGGQ